MLKIILGYLIFFTLNLNILFAQGVVAVPFVRIHPSPNLNGMAGAFTGTPTDGDFKTWVIYYSTE